MTPQQMLEQIIDAAWADFSEIARAEEEDGYSDAMVSMDRTRAEGFADGLLSAYYQVFGESYEDGEDISNVN